LGPIWGHYKVIKKGDYPLDKSINTLYNTTIKGKNNVEAVLKPFQLVSLWEMIFIDLGSMAAIISILTEYEKNISLASKVVPTMSVREFSQHPTQKKKKFNLDDLKYLLEITQNNTNGLGLEGSYRFSSAIINDLEKINITNLSDNLKKLRRMIEDELKELLAMYIPKNEALWFDNKLSFGEEVLTAFPSVENEIIEAGNCYALDRPTACVFHSMRILEYGLSALAKEVEITFDIQQWHTIIEKIEAEIKNLRSSPKDAKRDVQLQFLSEAAKEFMYFKDGWRNHVSHKKTIYDKPQAQSVLTHVKAFMIHLSSRLKE
jgi:hypothetical protein